MKLLLPRQVQLCQALFFVLWVAPTSLAMGATIVEINPPFSGPAFSAGPSYSVSYSPADAINLTIQNPLVPFPNTGQGNDNKWGVSGPGIGDTGWGPVIGADYAGEDAPELKISISGFTTGLYKVYGRAFTNSAPIAPTDYGARLGLSSSDLVSYFHSSGGTVLATGDGVYEIREFYLGSEFAADGTINVYLDDFDGTGVATAVLAGLRVEAVPEPCTAVAFLVGIGCLVPVLQRSKRASRRLRPKPK